MNSNLKKVLITGIDGFTGSHLASYLTKFNYDVYGTSLHYSSDKTYKCDITSKDEIEYVLIQVNPDIIIHLAGISFAVHASNIDLYNINTIGSINLLESIVKLNMDPFKIILSSSATVYGNQNTNILDESLTPHPNGHYFASKYTMELLASNFFSKLNILITRPFNYTGTGQSINFLIPKIVHHFKNNKKVIELGNLDVTREFNDVSFVCEAYKKLFESDVTSEVVNIASNRGINLLNVIDIMNDIAGYKIQIVVNQDFVRKNEIKCITGSNEKLYSLVGKIAHKQFEDTLQEMYNNI